MEKHDLEWYKKRIGKKVYRTASTCPCEVCKKVEDVGLYIADELHANYLYDCQNELDLYYFDEKNKPMKTAMQELIDELKLIEAYPMSPLVLKMAEELLQKEKEQIITDYSNGLLYALGYKHQDKNIDYGVTMQSKAEADIYYNQTYDQNK